MYYESTAIINILLFQNGDRLWMSESDVYKRQDLTSIYVRIYRGQNL